MLQKRPLKKSRKHYNISTMKRYILPFFIPFKGCPFKCIYCDQVAITNEKSFDIETRINNFYKNREDKNFKLEVAFFGGTFTLLDKKEKEKYFKKVKPFIDSGKVESIRISTRPDSFDDKELTFLKNHDVKNIELGVQSFNNKYLKFLRRGYKKNLVLNKISQLKKYNFKIGIQIMMGFPGQTKQEFQKDVETLISLNPYDCRIYPLTIIEGTELNRMYLDNNWALIDIDKAVNWISRSVQKIEKNNIEIRRIGLPHSVELEKRVTGGIYHPSIADKVRIEILKNKLSELKITKNSLLIVNPKDKEYVYKFSKSKKIKTDNKINRGDVFLAKNV